MLEINNKSEIRYTDEVVDYLNELIDALIKRGYFSFIDPAKQYVSDMRNYIEANIANLSKYPAPSYFSKYQAGMLYVTYQSNKRTTWYFFFLQQGYRYLVCYITNNHFEGQYIR